MPDTKNRYYKHSRVSEAKFRQILRCFAMDLTATETAQLTAISVRSINSIFLKIRGRVTELCEQESPFPSDDESRGNNIVAHNSQSPTDPLNKYLAFGVYRRGDQIYTEYAPMPIRALLHRSNRSGPNLTELVNHESWKAYDGLVDVNQTRLYRMNTTHAVTGEIINTMNSVDSFWSFAKRRLVQFNGIHKHTFYLHLKETEFRFNYRRDNLYRVLLKVLRTNPL
ncbi:IS1595 family transposase [Oceanicoccus sp. KOV_DT_Chl]|uniref:IS1595 family transposase n=1 Tax=Oceanicoccus sp. KOV_DT_Chl TaxID=1904639 RepID=UPI000C7BA853|nr:IS1595 family transposase [Oceanicoccus sp. KOV_DT_Chl]